MKRLKEVMPLPIASGAPKRLDRSLVSDWAECRQCHVGDDFLLIYRLEEIVAAE